MIVTFTINSLFSTRLPCPYLALSCAMAQLSSISSSHSPSSCSRDKTCQLVPHAECCHLDLSLLSWLAAERCDLLIQKLFFSDISAIIEVKMLSYNKQCCHDIHIVPHISYLKYTVHNCLFINNCPVLRAHRWKWKASSSLRSPIIPQACPEGPTGEWKWLVQKIEVNCLEPSISSFALSTSQIWCITNAHFRRFRILKLSLFSFSPLVIRPGSASPSGKPSGPVGPVGPLPPHYTQQVFFCLINMFECLLTY